MKSIGVILAGGSGRRLGSELPKQFITIAGKTVLAHTLGVFEQNELIDEIIIVVHKDYLNETQEIVTKERFGKVRMIIPGGKERYHSTLAALNAYQDTNCKFIIHDAVRLLVTQQMISDTIEALDNCEACTTAIPATDTILQSDATKQFVNAIPDRSTLFQVQTPQGFLANTLRGAYNKALTDPCFFSTDDCGVVKRYLPEISIKIIQGSPSNVKLTYKEDISLIERCLLG
ncbi:MULTISPECIES: 2-C-methyl-D-erythritol 4-phosphate cytidylyltransferase [Butyricimonas]|jgi:2-C-methyl-D-erythritol 4-phosphate cytidylyltransferase|uniref:2-C-methyl-D-erythritol 4-phosphate cytidylyltransferase n=1 Tax=Butyricimonas hominis TaxID=2763032 RepID=A0ABR7D5R4_9BACT|nr:MULTISPECIES: 2-C-methyl-D-erythritol 4-phosphate cytidylyltransferase [Butyricimonas]MBC5623134.1 2-C-methyl-D-erythritol 4-phosphate cytidylyltransferase [Butyricimonas hominis]MCB6973290.1 2-C-methyl-D-erythritol 4-phosphate cytidylyltransferase [Butyricimonas synergistica]MCG4520239.1 2-C-methyl-D-erythritol 4-phosphate cytidylyltransferase [Butyricimonas sp. DFI.6.44]